jgi:hypothetical protein
MLSGSALPEEVQAEADPAPVVERADDVQARNEIL